MYTLNKPHRTMGKQHLVVALVFCVSTVLYISSGTLSQRRYDPPARPVPVMPQGSVRESAPVVRSETVPRGLRASIKNRVLQVISELHPKAPPPPSAPPSSSAPTDPPTKSQYTRTPNLEKPSAVIYDQPNCQGQSHLVDYTRFEPECKHCFDFCASADIGSFPTWDDGTQIEGKVRSLRMTGTGAKARVNLHSQCLGHWHYKDHGLIKSIRPSDGCVTVEELSGRFMHMQVLSDEEEDMNAKA